MPRIQYIDTLSQEEYEDLKNLADTEGLSIEDFIESVIKKLLRRKPRPIDYTRHPSFGIWKNDARTDEEILNSISGGWEELF
ncbi:hypothetical protein FJZ31_21510 [Candidatus Poribacteria bacterium]|nr:hypothetical protein [Candidatus Poribacteria bacterium]